MSRVIVITGSTSGIGKATAEAFADDGVTVVIHGLDDVGAPEAMERCQSRGARTILVTGNLLEPANARRLATAALEAHGHVDVLVNNAGANEFHSPLSASLDEWQRAIDLDLRAGWLCARDLAPHMPEGSAIINVASNHALRSLPRAFPYDVAKAGVLALTRSLAVELGERRIRVNAVCPGYIDTPLNDRHFAAFDDPEAERRRVDRLHPLGRIGHPEEVARAIRFLADPREAGFITGTSILIDGGRGALLEDPIQ